MSEHIDEHTDEWFKHAPDEPDHMEAHGEIDSVMIMAFLAATIVIVVVTAILITQYFKVSVAEIKADVQEARADQTVSQPYREAMESWEQKLSEPSWVNRNEGVVGLPLDVAMDRVIAEYEGR